MAGKRPLFYLTYQVAQRAPRTPKAIIDKSGRVIAVLVGMPKDPFEQEVIAVATAAFQVESEALLSAEGVNSRGEFHAILAGFSHGGGTEVSAASRRWRLLLTRQQRPTATSTASIYAHARKMLTKHPAVVRLAGFQNRECHFDDFQECSIDEEYQKHSGRIFHKRTHITRVRCPRSQNTIHHSGFRSSIHFHLPRSI